MTVVAYKCGVELEVAHVSPSLGAVHLRMAGFPSGGQAKSCGVAQSPQSGGLVDQDSGEEV